MQLTLRAIKDFMQRNHVKELQECDNRRNNLLDYCIPEIKSNKFKGQQEWVPISHGTTDHSVWSKPTTEEKAECSELLNTFPTARKNISEKSSRTKMRLFRERTEQEIETGAKDQMQHDQQFQERRSLKSVKLSFNIKTSFLMEWYTKPQRAL